MNKWTMLLLCATVAACNSKADEADSGTVDDGSSDAGGSDDGSSDDGGSDDGGSDAGGSDGGSGSGDDGSDDGGSDAGGSGEYAEVEDYVAAYCSSYAVRCGVYSTDSECIDDIMTTWFDDTCVVASSENAATCIDYLSTLSCDATGWIDECDNILECD